MTTTSNKSYRTWESSPTTWDSLVAVTWDDSYRTIYDAEFDEVLSFGEGAKRCVNTVKTDLVGVADALKSVCRFGRGFVDAVCFGEQAYKRVGTVHVTALSVTDKKTSLLRLIRVMRDGFALVDGYERVWFGERVLRESCCVGEEVARLRSRLLSESLGVSDAYLDNMSAVMSNLTFYDEEMDDGRFTESMETVGGYGAFQDFFVGDYEYKRALLRVILTTENLDAVPSIYNMVMNVDIPDTDDRGSVDVVDTSSATKVYFNKFYYTAPEVSVTLRGGNTGDGLIIPRIVSLNQSDEDGRFFEVELVNASGDRVSGSVTWIAKGY